MTLLTCKHEEFKLPHPIRPMSGSAFRTGTKKARDAGTAPSTGLASLGVVNCPYARARLRRKAAGMTRVSDKFYTNPKTYYIAIIVASLPLV